MSKADLKEAMDLLEVKKPLRLSIKAHNKAPSFQVPSLPSGSIGGFNPRDQIKPRDYF
jgi:hypothetical protein